MSDIDRPTPEQIEAVRPTLARIIDSVLRSDELSGWDVGWCETEAWKSEVAFDHLRPEPASPSDELWVAVLARGEKFHCPPWVPGGWPWGGDLDNVVDGIEDFVSESRFAWGQQRVAWRPPPDPTG